MKLKFTFMAALLAGICASCSVQNDVPAPSRVIWEYLSFETTTMGRQHDASGVPFTRVWKGTNGLLWSVGDLATYLAKADWELVGQIGQEVSFKRPNTSPSFGKSDLVDTTAYY